jgi:hypothetical protein
VQPCSLRRASLPRRRECTVVDTEDAGSVPCPAGRGSSTRTDLGLRTGQRASGCMSASRVFPISGARLRDSHERATSFQRPPACSAPDPVSSRRRSRKAGSI